MRSHVWTCVAGIYDHWIAIVTGSGVSLYILVKEKYTDKPVRWKTILAIFFAGFLVSLFLAWQDQYTSAEWRGAEISRLNGLIQDQDEEIKNLRNELAQKDRPVVLQYTTDPEVTKLLKRQDAELARLKTQNPSPKKKALQLSNDILKFLAERVKNQPALPAGPTVGSDEESQRRRSEVWERVMGPYTRQVGADFQVYFGARVMAIANDMQAAGLTGFEGLTSACEFSNGNFYVIQECGERIGALSERLP
jgi:hypothetical protein